MNYLQHSKHLKFNYFYKLQTFDTVHPKLIAKLYHHANHMKYN